MRSTKMCLIASAAVAAMLLSACSQRGGGEEEVAGGAACEGQQTTGITKDSIKLGGIYPLSGPASAYGAIAVGVRTYFEYLNAEKKGIDGRKIDYTVRDDGYQPPKAVEEARRLAEQEQVFALFQTLGTPSTTASREYTNERKVPQVFVATGASKWGTETEQYPWTIGWQPSYVAEARVYAQYLQEEQPDATVAVLFQNDDFGKDLLTGFKDAIAGTDLKIVAEESYEVTDPTVEPQMRNLSTSNADVLLNITTPKFGSQALAADAALTDWNPLHIVNNVSSSITVLEPVGFDKVQGVVSATYFKDPLDPQWESDPTMQLYREKMDKYSPNADPNNPFHAYGWAAGESFQRAVEGMECPTREGLMKAVRSMEDQEIGMLLPGVTINTGPDDGFPVESMQLMRFKGERWELFGDVIDTREEFGPVE
ncbi:MAG: ABC transporter substrate-binding protein [Carbonactinosporaceae bacterium]